MAHLQKRMEFEALVAEEHLKHDKAIDFIEMAFGRGYVLEGGLELNGVMPSIIFSCDAHMKMHEMMKTEWEKYMKRQGIK